MSKWLSGAVAVAGVAVAAVYAWNEFGGAQAPATPPGQAAIVAQPSGEIVAAAPSAAGPSAAPSTATPSADVVPASVNPAAPSPEPAQTEEPVVTAPVGDAPEAPEQAADDAEGDAAPSVAQTPAVAPDFDIVRVDADGQMVVAGTANPGERVEILLDGKVVGEADADAQGGFVAVIFAQLSGSAQELQLRVFRETEIAAASPVAIEPSAATARDATPAPAPAPSPASETDDQTAAAKPAPETDEAAPTATPDETTQAGQSVPDNSEAAASEPATGAPAPAQPVSTLAAATETPEPTPIEQSQPATTEPAPPSAPALSEPEQEPSDQTAATTQPQTTAARDLQLAPATAPEPALDPVEPQVAHSTTELAARAPETSVGTALSGNAGQDPTASRAVSAPSAPTPTAPALQPSAAPAPASDRGAVVSAPVIILPSATGEGAPALLQPRQDDLALIQPSGDLVAGVVLDRISYGETGDVRFTGRGRAGKIIRIYGNAQALGTTEVNADGNWAWSMSRPRAQKMQLFRFDEIDETGSVSSRIETPFQYSSVSSQELRQRRVVVQRGDVLWRIAEQHYGAGIRYSAIYGANAELIRDPDLIYPGQVFSIPELVDVE